MVDTAETVATRLRGLNDKDGRCRWDTVGVLSRGPIVNRNNGRFGAIEVIQAESELGDFSSGC